jgi:hypothetical protein
MNTVIFLFVVLTQADGSKIGQDLAVFGDPAICSGVASILNAHPEKPADQQFLCREGKPGVKS